MKNEIEMNEGKLLETNSEFRKKLVEDSSALMSVLPKVWAEKIMGVPNLWEMANLMGACFNENKLEKDVKDQCINWITKIREFQGTLARESKRPTTVVFGTSGWREAIGEGFTVENVHKVARGIITMMKSPEFLHTVGYSSFAEVQKAGILVFRDNRFMGDEFKAAAKKELAAEGIHIFDAGECPTGVGSAIVTELKAAGSINFTPSHNPMEYAGIKFNPADGGPADIGLTSLIEKFSNAFMKTSEPFIRADAAYEGLTETIDAATVFTKFVEKKSKVFDLAALRLWLIENAKNLFIAIDNMHGSSRGYIQNLLGQETMSQLEKAQAIQFFNTEEDFSFHGVKPEPNAKNQALLMVELKKSNRQFTLGVALDPDADRIRFADQFMDIDMNRFGALAFGNLLRRGFKGGLATTVPSSGFASEIAHKEGREVFETAVGFKNFRAPLSQNKAMMAYEESDGISFTDHTLEKCALAGFLSALDCMASSGKNLSQLFSDLQKKYGWFYPGKGGADVKGVSVEAWQTYKDAVVKILEGGLFKPGDLITIGENTKKVLRINLADGLKIVFEDRSWILLRPSGTEPKFRYYFEVVGGSELADADALSKAYGKAAEEILKNARAKVAA